MPSTALFLILATLLPMVGGGIVLCCGRRMGTAASGWVAAGIVIASFCCTLVAMVKWYEGKHNLSPPWGMGERPINLSVSLFRGGALPPGSGHGFLSVGVYIDSLTIAMFGAITLVAATVHAYAVSYARYEPLPPRFFAVSSFLCFAVLALALSSRLVEILIFLECLGIVAHRLVGLCSIFEKPALRRLPWGAWLGQILADAALIAGVALLLAALGNVTWPSLWTRLASAAGGSSPAVPGLSLGRLWLIGALLSAGALWRSSQFPWQAWGAAAAGRSPLAGALLCTVTTLAGGVYLLARLYPILTPGVRLMIAVVGVTTLTMASLIALAQDDLPTLLGWLAVSQFGMMVLGIGVGSWAGSLFSLLTQSFFMTLLFLAGASVVAATRRRRLSEMGGLGRQMPVTFALFGVGALALAGAPLFSGHASQLALLGDAAAFSLQAVRQQHRSGLYWLLFFLPALATLLNSFSITRCGMLIFSGQGAGPALPPPTRLLLGRREHSGLWGPMLALAVPSLIAGYAMNLPDLLRSSLAETTIYCSERLGEGPRFTAFDHAWPAPGAISPTAESADVADPPPSASSPSAEAFEQGHTMARLGLAGLWFIAVAAGFIVYRDDKRLARRLAGFAPVRWIGLWLGNEMFFPDFYYWLLAAITLGASTRPAMRDRQQCGT